MHIRHIVLGSMVGLMAMTACSQRPPVTEQAAAKAAVTCLNWPEEIRDKASKIVHTNKITDPTEAIVFNFQHAKTVAIDLHGKCGGVSDTAVVSNAMRHFPPSSFTEAAGDSERAGMYILFLVSVDEKTGTRTFTGMKGSMKSVPLDQSDEPVGDQKKVPGTQT